MNWGMSTDFDKKDLRLWEKRNNCSILFPFVVALGEAKNPPSRVKAKEGKKQLKRLSDAIEAMDEHTKLMLAQGMVDLDLLPDNDDNPRHYDAIFFSIINAICERAYEMSETPTPRRHIKRDQALAFTHGMLTHFENVTSTKADANNMEFVDLIQIGLRALDYPEQDPGRLIRDALALDG